MSRSEKTVHVQATVGPHGTLNVDQLPYEPGQRVDVMISLVPGEQVGQVGSTNRYPLAGLRVDYEMPFTSVANDAWEAAR